MVALNPWEANSGDWLRVQGHTGLNSQFQDRLNYRVRSCLREKKGQSKMVYIVFLLDAEAVEVSNE